MTITANDPFKSPARISRDAFRTLLQNRAAAPVVAERDGGEYWDAIKATGVDPLFIAAMFNHESQMGKAGVATQTHSWGNTRQPSFGAVPIGTVAGRSGEFPVFRDWLDGCRSTCARLADRSWVYWDRKSIREIFDHPSGQVWAPAGDLNDPASYLGAVLSFMNQYADGGEVMSVDISGFTAPRIVQQWFKPNGKSYLGEDMQMLGVCIHETGNTDAGAEAQQNVDYMATTECINREASWHATVGLDTIIETIPQNKQAYHASDGSGPGNVHFKAIEGVMCYPVGSAKFKRVMMNHAWYAAKSLHDAGLPVVPVAPDADYSSGKTLAQHNDFARDHKSCPAFYRSEGLWVQFGEYVQAFYSGMAAPSPSPVPPVDNDGNPWFLHLGNGQYTAHALRLGFRGVIEGLAIQRYPDDPNSAALSIVGDILEDEWPAVDDCTYQTLRNFILKYTPGNSKPWDVSFLPVGATLPARKPV